MLLSVQMVMYLQLVSCTSTVIVGSGLQLLQVLTKLESLVQINGTQIVGRRNMIIKTQVVHYINRWSRYKTIDRWDTTKSGMDQLAFTQKQVTDSPNEGYSYSYEVDITTKKRHRF